MAVQQPLPTPRPRRASEVAGNATAEFTAVFCCLPCAAMEMVALAAYKVPAGLWKKMNSKRKRRMHNHQQKKNNDVAMSEPRPSGLETGIVGPTLEEHLAQETSDVDKLEEEMLAQFSGNGFWRSISNPPELESEMQPGKKDL